MATSRVITDQEIEDGLELLAELIDRYGDVYWPLFDRLERELEERRSKAARLSSRLKCPDQQRTGRRLSGNLERSNHMSAWPTRALGTSSR